MVFLKPKRTDHHLKQTNWHYHQFHLPQKPPTETTTQKNNPETEFSLNQEPTDLGFHVLIFSVLHNASVKRPASAGPLEQLVIRALDFDPEPMFWPCWYWTSRTLLPGFHNANYWFLQPTKISFVKSQTDQEIQLLWKTDKMKLPHFYLLQKPPTENITQKNNPPIWLFINPETSELGFRVLTFWFSYNAGVKRRRVALSAWMTC